MAKAQIHIHLHDSRTGDVQEMPGTSLASWKAALLAKYPDATFFVRGPPANNDFGARTKKNPFVGYYESERKSLGRVF